MTSSNATWSIVVPCYNASAFIRSSLARLVDFVQSNEPELGPAEIVAVDDGSSDATASTIEEAFPNVTVLRLPVNQGKGAAVRTGMLAATGEYRFFIDADIPFELDVLRTMLKYLREKEFDICIGRRSAANVRAEAHPPWLRRLFSRLFTIVISRLVVTGVRDTQCGLKGFRWETTQFLFDRGTINGFAFDVELLYLAFKADLDLKRIPVRLVSSDHSSVSLMRHGLPVLRDVCSLPVKYYSGKYGDIEPRDSP